MSEKDLSPVVQTLRDLTPKLNKVTDDANRAIRTVEVFLQHLSLGVPAEVLISQKAVSFYHEEWDRTVSYSDCEMLSFQRAGEQFRLVLKHARVGEDGDDERLPVALAECNRLEKLRAVAKLPDLLEEIAKTAQEVASEAASSVQAVNRLLSSLESTPLFARLAAEKQRAEAKKPDSQGNE